MDRLAIDIVLLPPEEIMNKAIEINRKFNNDPIQLNKKNCLPHISLCMGVIHKKDMAQIKEIIKTIVKNHKTQSLIIKKINTKHCSFDIENTTSLQNLHEEVMTSLDPYLTHNATTTMCFSPPKVDEKTLSWINGYKKNASFDNFYPHITLGLSNIEEKKLNIEFKANRLALCHLGNCCTCREILFETKLSKTP